MRSGLRPVVSSAVTVALQAKVGSLKPLEVERMRSQAEQLLNAGDPMRAAVLTFASQYEVVRWMPAALVVEAEALFRAAELALVPDPPGQDRRDIHG